MISSWLEKSQESCRLHLLSTALFRMTFFQDDIFTLIVSNGRLAHRDLCLVTGENFLHRLTHSWWFMSTLNLIVLFGRSMQDKRCVRDLRTREIWTSSDLSGSVYAVYTAVRCSYTFVKCGGSRPGGGLERHESTCARGSVPCRTVFTQKSLDVLFILQFQ